MASFRKRGSSGWQAQVRRKGYPAQSKSFSTRAAAVQWVRSIEYEMDQVDCPQYCGQSIRPKAVTTNKPTGSKCAGFRGICAH